MKISQKTLAYIIGGIVLLIGAWIFDPMVWLVHWRFPSAKVTNYYEYGWLVPGFLHTYVKPMSMTGPIWISRYGTAQWI